MNVLYTKYAQETNRVVIGRGWRNQQHADEWKSEQRMLWEAEIVVQWLREEQ